MMSDFMTQVIRDVSSIGLGIVISLILLWYFLKENPKILKHFAERYDKLVMDVNNNYKKLFDEQEKKYMDLLNKYMNLLDRIDNNMSKVIDNNTKALIELKTMYKTYPYNDIIKDVTNTKNNILEIKNEIKMINESIKEIEKIIK